jgi:hypothetical protein
MSQVTILRDILADDCRGIHAWRHACAIPAVRAAVIKALGDDGEEVFFRACGEDADATEEQEQEAIDWVNDEITSGLDVADDRGRLGRVTFDDGAIVWTLSVDADYWVCSNCLQLIANDDDSGFTSDEEAIEAKICLADLCQKEGGCLIPLSDCGDGSASIDFSRDSCDCCGCLPGARYAVAAPVVIR